MVSNTSRTGGYLVPTSINGEVNDKLFTEFLQPIVVGIHRTTWHHLCVHGGNQSRLNNPRLQCGLVLLSDLRRRTPDTFAAIAHQSTTGPTVQQDNVFRNEEIEVLCRFYGPNCEANAELLSVGFQVSQNREAMLLAGYSCLFPTIRL